MGRGRVRLAYSPNRSRDLYHTAVLAQVKYPVQYASTLKQKRPGLSGRVFSQPFDRDVDQGWSVPHTGIIPSAKIAAAVSLSPAYKRRLLCQVYQSLEL